MNDNERLLAWMAAHELTARALAQELGVRPSLISMIKSGERDITLNLQLKFIRAFGRDEAAKIFADSPVLDIMDAQSLATPSL